MQTLMQAFKMSVDDFVSRYKDKKIDIIAGEIKPQVQRVWSHLKLAITRSQFTYSQNLAQDSRHVV